MQKKQIIKNRKIAFTYLSLFIGAFIFAFSTYTFLIPARLIPGGITGIASVIQTVFKFPSQYTIVLINIPILIAAFFILDKRFALKTVIGIVCVTGFMELFSRVDLYTFNSSAEPFVPAIISGLLSGSGIGLMLNANASSGGTEVIGLLIQKKNQSIKLSGLLLIMNIITMAFGTIIFLFVGRMDINQLLVLLVCSVIQSILSSKSVDFILNGINSAVKFEIVTKKEKEISEAIKNSSEYGVTIIESKGAYLDQKSSMLIVVVHKTKMPQFKRLIKETDPSAFVFTTDTREILGSNFRTVR